MARRQPRSTLFPTRRSSDLAAMSMMGATFMLVGIGLLYGETGTLDMAHLSTVLAGRAPSVTLRDRKSTRLNSSHSQISYAVFCLKKKNQSRQTLWRTMPK